MQVMDLSYGDEAGLRTGVLEVAGRHAFGYLSAERGVHRLVRLSPYDPNHLRHTSFAEVEILPSAEEDPGYRSPAGRHKTRRFPFQRPPAARTCRRWHRRSA